MGQGHYMGIVWGITEKHPAYAKLTNEPDEDVCTGGLLDKYTGSIQRCYESQVGWLGFHIAMGGGVGDGDTSLEYTAMPLSSVNTRLRGQIRRAKDQWKKFAAWAKTKGVSVGPGALVLVADYD
jgi:hypothetical protein